MKRDRGWVVRGVKAAVVCGIVLGGGIARAQPGGAAELRQQLNDLAQNPQSVQQLVGTGRAALAVGDAEAAAGFFTRALEIAPNDPRAKAGLAAATAQAGQPESALVLFGEAVAAGASEADIAGDRGLAYDLTGQTARAQADYTLALQRGEDPEVRRRLALSLAISGQRDAALRLLDPQVRGGDRAAGRARAMVLALNGDVPGASSAAAAVMPPGSGQAMTPFFNRLAGLTPAQKAAAVNLGRIPSAGGGAYADTGHAATDPGALAFAGSSTAARPRDRDAAGDVDERRTGFGEPVRVAAASPTDAGRPRGAWPGASGAGVALPHPGQPLTGPLRDAVAPPPAEETAADPAPVNGWAASDAPVQVAVRQPQPQYQPQYQPPYQPQPAGAPQQGEVSDGAAANLAAWNRAGPIAPAPVRVQTPRIERPVASAVRTPAPRASFSDVATSVTNIDTAPDTSSRSRSRSRRSWRGFATRSLTAEVETPTPTRSRSWSRRSWRGLSAAPTITADSSARDTSGGSRSRGRRSSRGWTAPQTVSATSGRYGATGSTSRRGRGNVSLAAPATSGATRSGARAGRYAVSAPTTRSGRSGATAANLRSGGRGSVTATGRSGRNGAAAAITTNSRSGARPTTTSSATRRGAATSSSTRRGATSPATTRGASANVRATTSRNAASARTTTSARGGRASTASSAPTSRRTPAATSTRRPRGR